MPFKSVFSSIVLVLLLTFSCFGQSSEMTYKKAILIYDQELVKQNNNAFEASLVLMNKWRKADFEQASDWTKFIEFCLKQVKTADEQDHLCTELGYNLTQYNQFRDAFLYLYRPEHH